MRNDAEAVLGVTRCVWRNNRSKSSVPFSSNPSNPGRTPVNIASNLPAGVGSSNPSQSRIPCSSSPASCASGLSGKSDCSVKLGKFPGTSAAIPSKPSSNSVFPAARFANPEVTPSQPAATAKPPVSAVNLNQLTLKLRRERCETALCRLASKRSNQSRRRIEFGYCLHQRIMSDSTVKPPIGSFVAKRPSETSSYHAHKIKTDILARHA